MADLVQCRVMLDNHHQVQRRHRGRGGLEVPVVLEVLEDKVQYIIPM
jgi:hypothetical protein